MTPDSPGFPVRAPVRLSIDSFLSVLTVVLPLSMETSPLGDVSLHSGLPLAYLVETFPGLRLVLGDIFDDSSTTLVADFGRLPVERRKAGP